MTDRRPYEPVGMTRRDDAHATCRLVESRLREANRRLQATGPALERDTLIVALRANVGAVTDELIAARAALAGMTQLRDEWRDASGDAQDEAIRLRAELAALKLAAAHATDTDPHSVAAWQARARAAEADRVANQQILLRLAELVGIESFDQLPAAVIALQAVCDRLRNRLRDLTNFYPEAN